MKGPCEKTTSNAIEGGRLQDEEKKNSVNFSFKCFNQMWQSIASNHLSSCCRFLSTALVCFGSTIFCLQGGVNWPALSGLLQKQ